MFNEHKQKKGRIGIFWFAHSAETNLLCTIDFDFEKEDSFGQICRGGGGGGRSGGFSGGMRSGGSFSGGRSSGRSGRGGGFPADFPGDLAVRPTATAGRSSSAPTATTAARPPRYGGGRGCSSVVLVVVFSSSQRLSFSPCFPLIGFSSGSSANDVAASTVAREPLPAGSVNETAYYTR